MPDWRNYAKNRQMVSFNEFIADSSEYGLYCINKGVYRVLRYLAKERGLWRSTYYINLFDNGYTCPDVDEFIPIDRAISEFLGENDMSCDLLSGLRGIESAIRAIQCGGGGGGISVGPDGGIRYGSGRLYESPASDGAAQSLGFEDLTAYNEHKCQAANAIVSGLIASINNLAGLSLFNLVAGGTVLFAVGLLSNPPMAIIVLLAGLSLATGAFYGLADAIDNNRQSLVCKLYNSPDTIAAYDNFKADITGLIIEVYGVEVGVSVIVDLVASMCNTDVLNSLYNNVGLPSVGNLLPCNCGEGWITQLDGYYNTQDNQLTISGKSAYFTVSAVWAGNYAIICQLNSANVVSLSLSGVVEGHPYFEGSFVDEHGEHNYQGYEQFLSDISGANGVIGFYVRSSVGHFKGSVTIE